MGRLIPILIESGWTVPVALDMEDLTIGINSCSDPILFYFGNNNSQLIEIFRRSRYGNWIGIVIA